MTKAERLLKDLGLDYETLIKDNAWSISPLDFMSKIKIVLTIEYGKYHMFIWKNDTIQKECLFDEVSNITDVYSFLYNYDKNNLINKNESIRTNKKKS